MLTNLKCKNNNLDLLRMFTINENVYDSATWLMHEMLASVVEGIIFIQHEP